MTVTELTSSSCADQHLYLLVACSRCQRTSKLLQLHTLATLCSAYVCFAILHQQAGLFPTNQHELLAIGDNIHLLQWMLLYVLHDCGLLLQAQHRAWAL